jgi:hypothetical protein
MCEAEAALGVQSFFVMDENFLLYRRRALELLDRMRAGDKAWTLYVFSSANALAKYQLRELVELGISWVWLGLESPRSDYPKLKGTDTRALVAELQAHGIHVHGSTIVGLEHHTPQNIAGEIEHAVGHDADCHQFMLYTPIPGTPLYAQMAEERRLVDVDLADIHGQYRLNFRHAALTPEASKELLDGAFRLDYDRNGPSLFRMMRTMYRGWRRHREDPDPRVRRRWERTAAKLSNGYGAALWAMERYVSRSHPDVSRRIGVLRTEIERELGGPGKRIVDAALGRVLLWSARREARRFPAGRPREPRTWVERRHWQEAPAASLTG